MSFITFNTHSQMISKSANCSIDSCLKNGLPCFDDFFLQLVEVADVLIIVYHSLDITPKTEI